MRQPPKWLLKYRKLRGRMEYDEDQWRLDMLLLTGKGSCNAYAALFALCALQARKMPFYATFLCDGVAHVICYVPVRGGWYSCSTGNYRFCKSVERAMTWWETKCNHGKPVSVMRVTHKNLRKRVWARW